MPTRSLCPALLLAATLALSACAPASAPTAGARPSVGGAPAAPHGQPLPATPTPASGRSASPTQTPGPSPTLRLTDTPAIVQSSAATKIPAFSSQGLPVTGLSGSGDVMVGNRYRLGSILADNRNMALYILTQDWPDTPTCYGVCARAWPPLLASGRPVAGEGVDAAKLGTVLRTDGGTQVTYNGWPLYYSAEDTQPGDVKGQGGGGIWFVISPAGNPVR